MRIALFSDTYLPQINGVATHVKTLKDGLESIGHTVLVVTPDTSAKNHYVEDGILHCPAMTLKRLYDYGAASSHNAERQRILDSYAPDIVHIHTEFGVGWSGVETSRRADIPLIYTLHTMYDQYLHYIVHHPFIPAARRMTRAYIGYYGKIADEVIGPSVRAQDFLAVCGVHRAVNVIPNAVELDYFSREQADKQAVAHLREQYGISEGEQVLCFCGRLGQEKSIDELINFFAASRQSNDHIRLMVIGEGPMRESLEEQAAHAGLKDSIIFTGGISHDRMREIYACCDMYATTSRSEVNSISMLEAMAMGLPVLHIEDTENPRQVTEGVNGYLFHNTEEFCTLINRLSNAPEELKRLQTSTAASVHMAGQEGLARRVEAVYQSCIDKKHGLL